MALICQNCATAKPLAEGFDGTLRNPSLRVRLFARKAVSFKATFEDLQFILNEENITLEWIDSFYQTHDECNDFLFDFEDLQNGRGFDKRPAQLPDIPYKMARYTYTDAEIALLEEKIDLQLHIMNAKMNDIVLKNFMRVQTQSEPLNDRDSGSLGRTLPPSSSTQLEANGHQPEDEEEIKPLYLRINRLLYRLKRTGPQALSSPAAISQDEIRKVRRALKARFRTREGVQHQFAQLIQGMDVKDLKGLSEQNLKTLLARFKRLPSLTMRKRVYMREASSLLLPEPALALSMANDEAIVSIQRTQLSYPLRCIDIVTEAGKRYVVCIDKDNGTGIIHHLPLIADIYPLTSTRFISPKFHEREVSIYEPCLVETFGSHQFSKQGMYPLYKFPSLDDASSFQSSLRGKYLRHTFDTGSISSSRGEIAFDQPLKTWSDFDDGQMYITFLQHKLPPLGNREFPLDWFKSKVQDVEGKVNAVQIKFHFTPRKKSRVSTWKNSIRRASTMSLSTIAFRKHSGSSPRLPTAEAVGLGLHDVSPIDLTMPELSEEPEPMSTSPPRCRDATAPPQMRDYAIASAHLDIVFSDSSEMNLFKREFQRARETLGTPITSPKFEEFKFEHANRQVAREHRESLEEKLDDMDPSAEQQENSTITTSQQLNINLTSTTSGKSPSEQNQIYRVQGIPPDCDESMVEDIIRSILSLETPTDMELRSLAVSHDGNSQVATISLSKTPPCLSPSSLRPEDDWRFVYKMPPAALEGSTKGAKLRRYNISIDTHFRGLTILWAPEKPADHKVDICAVSGLGSHAYGSFKERGGSYMWLLDSLPTALKYARIMTYGFNTKLQFNRSNQNISELANYLLRNLEAMRTETMTLDHDNGGLSTRPLIFIAHSLGGLVVKEAMIHAKESNDDSLLDSIQGALFFGVPSRGMDIESLRPMVRDQPNELFLHTLGPDSPTLKTQSKKFRQMFDGKRPEIVYFFECQMSPTARFDGTQYKMDGELKMLVEGISATDGASWEEDGPKCIPLDKDHSHLVKFKAHDENYPAVLNVLKKMVFAALSNSNNPGLSQSRASISDKGKGKVTMQKNK